MGVIRFMKVRSLIMFGEENMCREYMRHNRDKNSKYLHCITANSPEQIRGLGGKIDILFLCGWWNRRHCEEILNILHIYMGAYSAKFIGDMNFVPPYLSDRYNSLNRSEEVSNPVENRFELLDL